MRSRAVLLAVALIVPVTGCASLGSPFGGGTLRGPGAAFEDYLAGSADRIVVELDHSPGASWDDDTPAEEEFVEQLERITEKEVEVRARQQLPANGGDYAYSIEELRELHGAHQDETNGNGTVVMHALFLDGEFQGSTAGLAFAEHAFAVFKGRIEDGTCDNDAPVCQGECPTTDPTCLNRASSSVREWKVTRSVAIHEAGHLFGLVNSPLPMVEDHEMDEDPRPETERLENRSHSSNRSSVMFWQTADVEQVSQLADDDSIDGGEIPYRFGELDVQDARALREDG